VTFFAGVRRALFGRTVEDTVAVSVFTVTFGSVFCDGFSEVVRFRLRAEALLFPSSSPASSLFDETDARSESDSAPSSGLSCPRPLCFTVDEDVARVVVAVWFLLLRDARVCTILDVSRDIRDGRITESVIE
jgi:hypothetical protein